MRPTCVCTWLTLVFATTTSRSNGTVIASRYRVERFLRQGGMGVVLLAQPHFSEARPLAAVAALAAATSG